MIGTLQGRPLPGGQGLALGIPQITASLLDWGLRTIGETLGSATMRNADHPELITSLETRTMDFLYFIILGIIAGWLAGKLTKGSGFGLFGNIIVGVIGALVGGLLAGIMGIAATNLIGRILIATGGAVVFLSLIRFIRK